nr:glycosyltransferase [uncultured Anaerostipes sp.]
MKKVLQISFMASYENCKEAGGNTDIFYIKRLATDDTIDFRLLAFEDFDDEYHKVIESHKANHITSDVCKRDRDLKSKIIRRIKDIPSRYFLTDKNGNFTSSYYREKIQQYLNKYKQEGYNPDVIIVEWTQVVLFIDEIKQIFPKAKCIAIEVDVSYLGVDRKRRRETSRLKRAILGNRYKKLKEAELLALQKFDLVYTQNQKDLELLKTENYMFPNLSWIAPWYNQSLINNQRNVDWNNPFIIFYGAMGRPENYLSVKWFIENVMPLINKTIKFLIIGSGSETVKNYASEQIIVAGFVDDVSDLFSRCLCMVAPLVLGAGIKVKVLEAMTAGIPVLTNDIGIEGIIAEDRKDYFYCKEPQDYVNVINNIVRGKVNLNMISLNARKNILDNYDFYKSADTLLETIKSL